MPVRIDSNIVGPQGGYSVGGPAMVPLSQTMRPMKQVWPAVDATNGPLTADTGIVAGTPSATGKTLFTPQSTPTVLNTQSQNFIANPAGGYGNTSAFTAYFNASTPRNYTFGTRTGLPMESNIDISFLTDSAEVTLMWFHYTGYSGSNYSDMQWYAEDDGAMKKITRMPATSTSAVGVCYRTLTFKEAREREHRILLPFNCWLIGVYINNNHTIRKAPNRFFCLINGDSWTEPQGGTIQSPAGGAFSSGGTYRTYYLPQAIIEETGWAVGLVAAGGTGEFNDGTGTARDVTYVSGGGGSVFHGQARINDMATKFFARSPVVWTIGGWNDGNLPGSPYGANYLARIQAGINYYRSKKSDIKLIYSSIQPVAESGSSLTAARLECITAQAAAWAANPDTVIGFVDMKDMWADKGTGGPRAINCGADTIHLNAKGANQVGGHSAAAVKNFLIPADYYKNMLTAA